MEKPDANWWSFSIMRGGRREKIGEDPLSGTVEVNPDMGGKRLLSYHRYLGLDKLLGSQTPVSFVPDERVFIITHQLFELIFKQIIFDLGVISETFRVLLAAGDEAFTELTGTTAEASGEDFWSSALTSSARLKHSCGRIISDIMTYLAAEETFNNEEFEKGFRENLAPASGFQSAQFRLIQRALGKSALLGIRLFPADTYLKYYFGMNEKEISRIILESEDSGLVRVVDGLILQESAAVASPADGSPLSSVSALDDTAHKVLMRLSALKSLSRSAGDQCEAPLLPYDESSVDEVAGIFRRRLEESLVMIKKRKGLTKVLTDEDSELIRKRTRVFRDDWSRAVNEENARRISFGKALGAAAYLFRNGKTCQLKTVLDGLLNADEALSQKFLSFHRTVVAKRIGSIPGTAGGGVPFLDLSISLTSEFPALALLRACKFTNPQDRT